MRGSGCERCLLFPAVLIAIAALAFGVFGQSAHIPRELFFDSNGCQITNNEFVDIRMANPSFPDNTRVSSLEDGTKEFHLQRVPQEGLDSGIFSITTVDGKTLQSTDLRGKVVVMNFWFIGCAACAGQEPKLNSFKKRFSSKEDLVFIAATADEAEAVKKYLKKNPFDYTHAADAEVLISHFSARTYPTNIVIGRDGKIAYWRSIISAWDTFEAVVRAELAK